MREFIRLYVWFLFAALSSPRLCLRFLRRGGGIMDGDVGCVWDFSDRGEGSVGSILGVGKGNAEGGRDRGKG